jgi:DNA/RNA endonuclease YhcR with UshA esterase domain
MGAFDVVFLRPKVRQQLSRSALLALGCSTAACVVGGQATEGIDDGDAAAVVTIAEARGVDDGAVVNVEDNVSVAPGAFASAMGDQGFALQDDTGGLYVKLDFDVGQRVRVTGTIGEQAQLRIVTAVPADVATLDGGEAPTPREVTTGEVAEPVEGLLVEVQGAVTQTFQDDSPYGYKLAVDDGSGEVQIFVHIQPDTDAAPLQQLIVGDALRVVGLAAQYETTYEVAPRTAADLEVLP